MNDRKFLASLFFTILFAFSANFAQAQNSDFYQTGQVRVIVSETEPENATRKNNVEKPLYKISGKSNSKQDFYFTYPIYENSATVEKWAKLPDDRDWSRLSNQTIQISGSLLKSKLSNIKVSPMTAMSESYLAAPPATVGLYKTVVVPLTVQPLSASGEPIGNVPTLNVAPETVRNYLFNDPKSVNNFYQEASYGKFGFKGVRQAQSEVVPMKIEAMISETCQEQIISEFTPTVQARLLEQNINTTNGDVDLGIIIFNNLAGCPPYPFATRGALGNPTRPLWLWMPESWFVTGPLIMAHEIGHALGGNHPAVIRCEDFDKPETCTYSDAADRDIMTSAGRFYMMPNNYQRRRWGWHPPGAFDSASSGFVRMFDLHSSALPFIKDGKRQGRFFYRNLMGNYPGWGLYPESRRNWGLFEQYEGADEAFRLGVALRFGHSNYGDPDALSIIIDPNDTPELDDAPLRKDQKISFGKVLIECIREHNPSWGTRIRVQ